MDKSVKDLKRNEVVINILDGRVTVMYLIEGSLPMKKETTVNGLVRVVEALKNNQQKLEIYPYGLRFDVQKGNRVMLGYETFPRIDKMFWSPTKEKEAVAELSVPYPGGLTVGEFEVTPKGLVFRQFHQFALKGPVTGEDVVLYQWPSSNVYGAGNCCMGGGFRFPENIKERSQTESIPSLFLYGVYNNDLDSNRFSPYKTPEGNTLSTSRSLWAYLNGKKEFPLDIMKQYVTLGDWLKQTGMK